ncbi:hypothetical protein GCM10007870_21820 [Gluconobacter kondonii]|uniref:Integrase catalytic domain-containing protein n=2 Tax=Gluconobacter kondonii TaxID=941463 RepID=A0ABQ5WU25_9PROT|nr:hypothetical protein GCM10007870_21820 [Gluconobacter kondonii]
MGQIRHGSATTTHAVRAAIQRSQASLAALSKEFGINPKTVAKWRKRQTVEDQKTGPKEPRSTVLSETDEAMIVAFRRHTLLPLDDCLYALQASIPHLTRSALHRCLQRHGISRLPDIEGDKPKRQRFKRYPIGFFHIEIAEVQTAEGKLYLFVAIDRTSKFAVTQLVEKADRKTAWEFLEYFLSIIPYRIHTILTDNGIQFADQPLNRNTAWSRPMRFDMICEAHGIEHRLTKPNHPWTNGQVERMNRTIKEATVKRFHYDSHEQLRTHLNDFMAAYNFGRRLKTLNGLTPYEYVCKIWTSEPERFIINPTHQIPGLNNDVTTALGGNVRWIDPADTGLNILSVRFRALPLLPLPAGLLNEFEADRRQSPHLGDLNTQIIFHLADIKSRQTCPETHSVLSTTLPRNH